MDSVIKDVVGECIAENQDTSAEELMSPESPKVNDIFGDPKMLARVGDQYQVEIPSLVTESELLKHLTDQDYGIDIRHSFLVGLHIPIMWIHDESNKTRKELLDIDGAPNGRVKAPIESENSKENKINLNNGDSIVKAEPLDFASDSVTSCELAGTGIEKGCSPAPGSLSNSWSDFEQESFLLGLYMFGKNLVLVKNFMGSREIGDILSFYYGIFYKSDRHRRWSECRKSRSRKCIHGHRIFTGWRQQELLSRLLPRVSEECQNTLLEVSRRFGDGKISLEDYVSMLKDKVGINLLIEAVGIGKGKQDLTGIIKELIKTDQVMHTRPEVPVGKACSSLTSEDILKFLTGDLRLSKARANDLFWEAVWPRLLGKGWHSEEPKNSKNSLVFLVPGISKFSRRRLVKGVQYFDCVSDVLNKVASEPRLLEELDEDVHFDHQRPCYLQPRVSNSSSDNVKFIIVDTTLVLEEPGTVVKLRSLPVESIEGSAPIISRKDNMDNSKEPVDKLDSVVADDHMDTDTSGTLKHMSFLSGFAANVSKQASSEEIMKSQSSPVDEPQHTDIIIPMGIKRDCNTAMSDKNPSKIITSQFSRRQKGGQTTNIAPITKRRRLSACSHDDEIRNTNNICIGPEVNEKELHLCLESHNGSESIFFEDGFSHAKVSTTSLAKDSPNDIIENVLAENCYNNSAPQKCFSQTFIDLNIPHPSPDSLENSQDYQSTDASSDANHQLEGLPEVKTTHEQPVAFSRRQSTRNRPLTTKALEALELGYLTTKSKTRVMEPISEEKNFIPKFSRRARGKVSIATNFDDVMTSTVDSKEQPSLDEECGRDRNMANGTQLAGTVILGEISCYNVWL